MNKNVREQLATVLANWQKMQSIDSDDAEEDANRFQYSFYKLIDEIKAWFHGLQHKPATLEEAMLIPEIAEIADRLPGPLHINFETELELILEGIERQEDNVYD